jgi:CubicO group peptidase (beta-lactamase class C family)
MRHLRIWALGGLGVASVLSFVLLAQQEPDYAQIQVSTARDLERELERLREPLQIAGMSAAIADQGRIVWTAGFGWANVERKARVQSETIFHLASLTKPYAATILLQLFDEGRVDLDAQVSDFGIKMPGQSPVRVWHLLSHTSSSIPGTVFRYDGGAYGQLTQVIERVAGRPFAAELAGRIIGPLGLKYTAPNPRDVPGAPPDEPGRLTFAASGLERAFIDQRLATGYARQSGQFISPAGLFGSMRPQEHATYLFASAGLVATAEDVARFSIALDEGRLLRESTRTRAYTAVTTQSGEVIPYGLGWFVQQYRGIRVVWHFGQASESSSLIVKLPDQQVTFVALANSDGLSRGRRLGDRGNVLLSPAATLFLNWYAAGRRL